MAWVCLYLTPWAKRGGGHKGKCAHEWQGSCLDLGRNCKKHSLEYPIATMRWPPNDMGERGLFFN
jgi:hypothetical protein